MQLLTINNKELYVFAFRYLMANMYVMIEGHKALVVDAHYSHEALEMLKSRGVDEVTILLTHEHPDHTNGVPLLQAHFKTRIICQNQCAEAVADVKNNQSQILEMILLFQDEKNGTKTAEAFAAEKENMTEYVLLADEHFDECYDVNWQGHIFRLISTPGHTKGSCCIEWNKKAVFTGDSLLKNIPVITRFPGGNTKQYNAVTKPYLDSLPDDMVVLPGHGESFIMKEIRKKAA